MTRRKEDPSEQNLSNDKPLGPIPELPPPLLPASVRNNPFKSALIGLATMITLISGIIALDDRYCKAAEKVELTKNLQEEVQSLRSVVAVNSMELEQSAGENYMSMLEDKVFELELQVKSGKATPVEEALLERAKLRMRTLSDRQNTRGMEIKQLRTKE